MCTNLLFVANGPLTTQAFYFLSCVGANVQPYVLALFNIDLDRNDVCCVKQVIFKSIFKLGM